MLSITGLKQQTQHLGLIIIDIQTCTQGGIKMTKAEIVEKVAAEIKVSKAAAARALAVVTGSIADALRKGGKVTLIGLGTFSVASRKARKGRNPQTGKEIKIAAKKVPRFSAGAALKAAATGKAAPVKAKVKKAPAKKAAKPKKK
jgi:DNA-binding protein HU-beta